ncbi:type II toxin-antitoxin system YafQ family toxin [Candidatus Peregrinibacteria bacterium]|nr:type II toxin-antitoxin system YafQ family toxin [Candidatus Peregrinibacteria bacterium]MBI3816286.1 type II toxin-antitoxin system YafQ family toxin [Candidatus Peregrinibacteria bacterium]
MKRYHVTATKRYKKDYKRIRKSGFDMEKLENVIDRLASGLPLNGGRRDHALRGAMQGTRACHIAPDWLLRYGIDGNELILILVSTGTHRDVLSIE